MALLRRQRQRHALSTAALGSTYEGPIWLFRIWPSRQDPLKSAGSRKAKAYVIIQNLAAQTRQVEVCRYSTAAVHVEADVRPGAGTLQCGLFRWPGTH